MKKRDDKAFTSRREGKTNARAVTPVNVVAASSTPPTSKPAQLELFPGRACPLEAKPARVRYTANPDTHPRNGVKDDGTRGQNVEITGETRSGPVVTSASPSLHGREAHKSSPRKRGPEAGPGVGSGHSTDERRDNRREGRTATSTVRSQQGKAAGLPPRGKASSRQKSARRDKRQRMDSARKLQRTLYRVAKSQPHRRFTLLYDKVCRWDVLWEAWRRVKANGGSAGIDRVDIDAVTAAGETQFVQEIQQELQAGTYRAAHIRRVHIPKPGQPDRTRPLGIPTVKDRLVQMAVVMVTSPLFEADFYPCSYGFRPQRTPRMALSAIVEGVAAGYHHVVDVDLRAYFDTLDQDMLIRLVERRIGDQRILGLLRAWLKAGVLEDGKVSHPLRGTPQGGVVSPLLANIYLHEVDRQWCTPTGTPAGQPCLIRYADDMVILTRTEQDAQHAWARLQDHLAALGLTVNEDKSRLTTVAEGFQFLGFEFCHQRGKLYLWPRTKAVKHIGERIRHIVRSVPSTASLTVVIEKLNPVLNGWCTYFRVGHSNRIFHKADWMAREAIQLWLRRKHQLSWRTAKKRWDYRMLHQHYRLYRMVGKVSHLEGLGCMPPEERGRRAVYGKTVRTVR